MSGVDYDSPLPLYHQLARLLEQQIASGQSKPGDLLPTEKEIAAQYGVGLQTVRAAMAQLKNKGLVTSRAGKGTFVAEGRSPRDFLLDRSFSRQMRELGWHPGSKVLRQEIVPASEELAGELAIAPGELVLALHRLRYGDHEPVGLQYTTVVTRYCRGIETHDFTAESLYEVLCHGYGLEVREIAHLISCTAADREQAGLLGVRVRAPLLVVRTRAVAKDGMVLEQTLSYYRTDRWEFRTTQGLEPVSSLDDEQSQP